MNPIDEIRGYGVPLPGNDIDTDQIIESRHLKVTTFRGIEAHLFESRRQQTKRNNGPYHPLDDPRFSAASILIVNSNFGCGSSREHAPQAIQRYGIKAIVGVSFGEIFACNCLTIGLPCLPIAAGEDLWLQQLCEDYPATEITLSITNSTLSTAERSIQLNLADGTRRRLLSGSWDSLSVLLEHSNEVEAKFSRTVVNSDNDSNKRA